MKTKVINLYAGSGAGKCHSKGTEILMYDLTSKKIEDIQIGDLLRGPDGQPRTVLRKFNGKERLYNIIPKRGNIFKVTGNHKLSFVLSGETKWKNLKTNHIYNFSINEYLTFSNRLRNSLKLYKSGGFEILNKKVTIDPYYLGLWLGDGHSADISRITTADIEIVHYLKHYAESLSNFYSLKKVGNSRYSYSISGTNQLPQKYLREQARYYNIINNKHIPTDYILNDRKTRLAVLAGLIDSDGYVHHNYIELTLKLKNLIQDVQILCGSLGFNTTLKEKIIKNKIYYKLTIIGDLTQIPTLLPRKNVKFQQKNKDHLRTGIKEISLCENEEEYYGIEVDKDHLYMLKDFTVTHNSTTAAHLYALMKQKGHEVELVREYVKNWAWEGRKIVPSDQLYILSKQLKSEKVLYGKVDYVITDSPVLLCAYYDHKHSGGKENFTKYLVALKEELSSDKEDLNFFINRSKPYNPKGRYETEEQAKLVDVELRGYLKKYFNTEPIEITAEDEKKAEEIYKIITMYKGGL